MNGETLRSLKWRLFRSFFRSRSAFLDLFERYEERVLAWSERLKTDRTRLRLPADELLALLDFKSLEDLRNREIHTLKETAHELFRKADTTDRFDHFVANIYHELSILKEEHYTVKEDFVRADEKEYRRFFREVAEYYPKRLRHVRNLYGKALRRLEELLPEMARERVLVRSIYLFGEELLGNRYPGGLSALYEKMYPVLGEVEGYAEAGRSFLESGFREKALEAFRKALSAAGQQRKRRKRGKRLDGLRAGIRSQIEDLEKAQAADRRGGERNRVPGPAL